jgi:hypothetical protein
MNSGGPGTPHPRFEEARLENQKKGGGLTDLAVTILLFHVTSVFSYGLHVTFRPLHLLFTCLPSFQVHQ